MTLPTGQISLSQVDTELSLGASTAISYNDLAVRTLAGISSGAISASDLKGKVCLNGSTAALAAPSALYIKYITGTTVNGIYWVTNPATGAGQQVYCDMNTDGGGWMLVARSNPNASGVATGSWGWRGPAIGTPAGYTNVYQLGIYAWCQAGFQFSTFIFGNQVDNISNNWGPFIYKVGLATGWSSTFLGSDTQQSGASYTTLKYNLNVYGSSNYPGMQGAIGYPVQGTSNNIYYLRDCCGFSGYGILPTGMNTTYINATGSMSFVSGPWVSNTLSGNTYVQGGSSSATNIGGCDQVLLMVR